MDERDGVGRARRPLTSKRLAIEVNGDRDGFRVFELVDYAARSGQGAFARGHDGDGQLPGLVEAFRQIAMNAADRLIEVSLLFGHDDDELELGGEKSSLHAVMLTRLTPPRLHGTLELAWKVAATGARLSGRRSVSA